MQIAYIISGIGYNSEDCVTDYECDFQIYEDTELSRGVIHYLFNATVRNIKDALDSLGLNNPELKYIKFQLEKCRVTEAGYECFSILAEEDVEL